MKILRPLIQPLEKALDAPGSLVIDGTLIPVWNWRSLGKINFSGKHKRAGFNHQVICTVDGKLLAITDQLPGARHDAFAFREHGLEEYLGETTLADKGYVGLGLLIPTKRKPGLKMPKVVKDNNRVINEAYSLSWARPTNSHPPRVSEPTLINNPRQSITQAPEKKAGPGLALAGL